MTHSPTLAWFTEPGTHADRLREFPDDLPGLMATLNQLLVHPFKIPEDREARLVGHCVFVRRFRRLLEVILQKDSRDLSLVRRHQDKVVADCRNFSLALSSILIHRGYEARLRCGFASYLADTHWQDHWIVEYRSSPDAAWVRGDADLRREGLGPQEFLSAGEAWLACEAGTHRWDQFGFGPGWNGRWAVRLDLLKDLHSLLGWVAVSGDSFGWARGDDADLPAEAWTVLHEAAVASQGGGDEGRLRELVAAQAGLQLPERICFFDYLSQGFTDQLDWRVDDGLPSGTPAG